MVTTQSQAVLLTRALDRREVIADDCWAAALCSKRSPAKRSVNEDAAMSYRLHDGGLVLAVADGCGGMKNGEKASRLALKSLAKSLDRRTSDNQPVRNYILDGIERANHRILKSQLGSACTIAVVEIHGNQMRSYHVGDSMIMVIISNKSATNRSRIHPSVTLLVPVCCRQTRPCFTKIDIGLQRLGLPRNAN